jgi:hypothetical protein
LASWTDFVAPNEVFAIVATPFRLDDSAGPSNVPR